MDLLLGREEDQLMRVTSVMVTIKRLEVLSLMGERVRRWKCKECLLILKYAP